MDHLILGLLLLSSRTIYQLRGRITKGLHLMYSDSLGSIQAALKKLLHSGYIRCEEVVLHGRYQKIYSITDSGRTHFFEWINTPMSVPGSKNPELAKLYFMGFSAEENRAALLESYISQLKEQYDVLDAICQEGETVSISDANQRDIVFYQLAAARYGRDLTQFNISWYQKLLNEGR